MALDGTIVWEVQTGGDDANGGGYSSDNGGTDYSQQAAAQLSLTDLATSGIGVTTLTSATGGFTSAMVDNIIQIASGTNVTAGFYRITAYTNTNTVTLDRAPDDGVGGVASGVGKVGGALLTVQTALDEMSVAGMQCYVKGGTYVISTGLTNGTANSNIIPTHLIGYSSSRGDGGQPIIQASAAITLLSLTSGGRSWNVFNFLLDGNADTGSVGLHITDGDCGASNIKVQDVSGKGIHSAGASGKLEDCEVSGAGATAGIHLNASYGTSAVRCWSHDNTVSGFVVDQMRVSSLIDCRATNNTGASSDGIEVYIYNILIQGCICHKNGRDGIRKTSFPSLLGVISNNILSNNLSGYGINFTQSSSPDSSGWVHNNAFLSNTSGARNNIAAGSGDVVLSSDPYTDAANDDFTLNNTAGGGAACRAAGVPANRDIGTFQHADPAGGALSLVNTRRNTLIGR